eukprot:SM000116S24223  [mRNA]  locus=s116:84782:93563:- [translate_table: standard]
MAIQVDAKTVQAVEVYKWLPIARRLDVLPFALAYTLWLAAAGGASLNTMDVLVGLGGLGLLHILTVLFTGWSVDFLCYAHAQKVKDLYSADICKVIPTTFSGKKEVVPVVRRMLLPVDKQLFGQGTSDSKFVDEEFQFVYRKQHFLYSQIENKFEKLKLPTKEPVEFYMKAGGYGTEAKVQAAMQRWGKNVFEFPQPTFGKLMKEQCMEPFFVFQVFCVALWCLDDYWQFSLFTLFMLLVFESTVVKSRLRTLMELRRVRVDSQSLNVHRGGKWVKIPGSDLVPGDVLSIGRSTAMGSEERTIPADMLLLAGSAIANEALLTGESTPQWKGPVIGRELTDRLSIKRDKAHVLFGGTKILQHTPDKMHPVKTPDGGCLAVVLRTGFNTSQGKLMRTILFSTERVSANSKESGLFILFLVFFALIASGYVLIKGLEDPNRSRYKLLLNCSLIVTSVIPPELPMELSIAVNSSLISLARRGIYCTEPFRIPFGGKVDTCCFDKTGTLTSDDMEFQGVAGTSSTSDIVTVPAELPQPTVLALAACHALVFVDNKLVGDPLEKAALKGVDWSFTAEEKAISRKGPHLSAQIVQRHHFASHLKRMAVIARVEDKSGYTVLVKGAPEMIQAMLKDVPADYTDTFKRYTRQGSRVLALAHKSLSDMPVTDVRKLERGEIESDLTFSGFAVFACPLRADSADVLKELSEASHELIMITGDQALTACHVAAQVHVTYRVVLILTPSMSRTNKEDSLLLPTDFVWLSTDESISRQYRVEEVESLALEYDLCLAGDGLTMLQRTDSLDAVIPFVQVFARVAPDQKELILTTLKTAGKYTLMCGDGTNDVGALKQAHVGVALLNVLPTRPAIASKGSTSASDERRTGAIQQPMNADAIGGTSTSTRKARAVGSPSTPGFASAPPIANGSHPNSTSKGKRAAQSSNTGGDKSSDRGKFLTPLELQRKRLEERQAKLKQMMKEAQEAGDGRSAPLVQLGDASMAAPFTAKHASVRPTVDVLRQGRSTLVTTLQMFKILGLNCLATAYVLSVMHLDGVKLGDSQATIGGIFTTSFFLFISQAKPLERLSATRPQPQVFSLYVILSLLGQFVVHLTFLGTAVSWAKAYMPQECIEPESTFHPNLVNTVSYMANMMIQVATFAVNYIGHPFNQSITENRPFFYALTLAGIFFTVLTSDTVRPLNQKLELVELPQPFGRHLLLMAALMFAACYAWEHMLRALFPVKIKSRRQYTQNMSRLTEAPSQSLPQKKEQ